MKLGPAPAAGLWTQGCSVYCPGCMSPGTWSRSGGVLAWVADVARWLETTVSRYLTISGGEPTEQAAALNELLALLGGQWVVTMYSGHDLSTLRAEGGPDVAELLNRVDVLIAGPYLIEQHASLLWRGSSNQIIHDLTGRAPIPNDITAGVDVRVGPDAVEALGVPPVPRFIPILKAEAAQRGVRFVTTPETRTFPFPAEEN